MKQHVWLFGLSLCAVPAFADDAGPVPQPVPAPTEAPAATGTDDEITDEVTVVERSSNRLGSADTASEGTVGPEQLKRRPLQRPGELLETVPGLIVTQHSGSGKANQYFLRGFNLDHGTDFATKIDGVPINFPTHAHGQGWMDISFLIPELVQGVTYRKGSYSASQGDFSAAGSADVTYANRITGQRVVVEGGAFGHRRLLLLGSPGTRKADVVYGLELQGYDGPFVTPENYRKINGILRVGRGDQNHRWTLSGLAYHGKWNSTDQIPLRAVQSGQIPRFGEIDPTDGGISHRYSLNGQYHGQTARSRTDANAYFIDYKLNLFSNFTYFLDDPVRGDQFEQADNRRVFGANAAHILIGKLGARPMQNEFGLQIRHDNISPVGLYLTQARNRFDTVREDAVKQTSVAPYFENRVRWAPKFRTVAGLRYDNYHFDVNASNPLNSGKNSDSLLSPKLSLIFGPFKKSEFYFNAARAFHSNDARGTTITVDPKTGDPAMPVTPLVKAKEAELGYRFGTKTLQSTFALWTLKLDSELLFTGDAGTTEPSRPTRRSGVEFANYWTPKPWLTFDADFALARARFSDVDPAGKRVPGAVEGVIAAGVAIDHPKSYFGALRLRYFGPRPLIEDNSVRSSSTFLMNAQVGYHLKNHTRVALDIFNLLNAKVSEIDYYYQSRLPGEPTAGVNDIHFHPSESRSLRLALSKDF